MCPLTFRKDERGVLPRFAGSGRYDQPINPLCADRKETYSCTSRNNKIASVDLDVSGDSINGA